MSSPYPRLFLLLSPLLPQCCWNSKKTEVDLHKKKILKKAIHTSNMLVVVFHHLGRLHAHCGEEKSVLRAQMTCLALFGPSSSYLQVQGGGRQLKNTSIKKKNTYKNTNMYLGCCLGPFLSSLW
jgi:hypothetical protein